MAADRPRTGVATVSIDSEILRALVDRQIATAEEAQRCRQMAEQDNQRSLAQILVTEEVVTQGQIDRIKKTIMESSDRQIPGYRILEKLGSGGMATVYKATQLSLDRQVAIKILPKRLSENAEYVKLFYKDGKAAAKLNHANIVQAIDVGEANGFHYFVMEYVKGHTVYDELAGGKVFSEADALKIIIQVARALQHAHGQGLIHRDVKPKNIMLTPEGDAKLADMGLARAAEDQVAAQAEAGRAYGTPYYISPEQIRGELNIDFRADIYSLGATFYHMVTGRVPFDAPTPVAVMQKHLKETLVPPDHINTSLSSGLGEVVEVMMAKNRNQRYASTSDLLVDLQAIEQGEPPLQARKQIDGVVLSGLASGVQSQESEQTMAMPAPGSLLPYVIILAAVLAISVILNVILLLR
jgi:serine/threonine protein kinase